MLSFQDFKGAYLKKQDDKTRGEFNDALQEYEGEFNSTLRREWK